MSCPAWQYPHCGTSSSCHARCSGCDPLGDRPSIVVTFFAPTVETCVWHDRTGEPSPCTVQAPHWPMPQPNFVPFMCSVSRRTQSSGMSPGVSTECVSPLTTNEYAIRPSLPISRFQSLIVTRIRTASSEFSPDLGPGGRQGEVVHRPHVVAGHVFAPDLEQCGCLKHLFDLGLGGPLVPVPRPTLRSRQLDAEIGPVGPGAGRKPVAESAASPKDDDVVVVQADHRPRLLEAVADGSVDRLRQLLKDTLRSEKVPCFAQRLIHAGDAAAGVAARRAENGVGGPGVAADDPALRGVGEVVSNQRPARLRPGRTTSEHADGERPCDRDERPWHHAWPDYI